MLLFVLSIISVVGVVGVFLGLPVLAYVGGIAAIIENVVESIKGKQTSMSTFVIAILFGIGFSATSNFSWWQGILIAFTFEGAFMFLLSVAVFWKYRRKNIFR